MLKTEERHGECASGRERGGEDTLDTRTLDTGHEDTGDGRHEDAPSASTHATGQLSNKMQLSSGSENLVVIICMSCLPLSYVRPDIHIRHICTRAVFVSAWWWC